MYLIYVDESGDTGLKSRGSPTDAFVLVALCAKDDVWLDTLDRIVAFRRFLRQHFSIRQRDELRAGYLILWGDSDPILKFEWSDNLGQLFTDQTLKKVEGAGHFMHREQPERGNREIIEFLT